MSVFHLFSPEREHIAVREAKDLETAFLGLDSNWQLIARGESWGLRLLREVEGTRRVFGYLVPALQCGREHYLAAGEQVLITGSTRVGRTQVENMPVAACCNQAVSKLMAQAPALELALADQVYTAALTGRFWSELGLEAAWLECLEEAGTVLDRPELAFYLAVVTGGPIPCKEPINHAAC